MSSKSHKIRTHKVIDNESSFLSVFPEEMSEIKNPQQWGDIDNYRASWETPDYGPRHGRVVTDDSDMYDPEYSPYD